MAGRVVPVAVAVCGGGAPRDCLAMYPAKKGDDEVPQFTCCRFAFYAGDPNGSGPTGGSPDGNEDSYDPGSAYQFIQ
jgi:hypothetical protein